MLPSEPAPLPAHVEFVGPAKAIDGDTLRVGAVTVRLWGIDAPEADQACTRGRRQIACGAQAADHLRESTQGVIVRCASTENDRYGRPIAICTADGRDLASDLVQAGWAVAFRDYSTRYVPEENAAKAARRGLWATNFELPSAFRRAKRAASVETGTPDPACPIKGNISAKGERIFHLPGSRAYPEVRISPVAGERWFCSPEEALEAGWRAVR